MYWFITVFCFIISIFAFGQGSDTAAAVFGMIALVMFIVKLVMIRGEYNIALKQEIEAERQIARRQQRDAILKVSYDAELSRFTDKYGEVTKKIIYGGMYDLEAQFLVFESADTVLIKGVPYSIKQIVSFRVHDDTTIIPGEVTYRNETKDVAKRVVLGHMIAGGFGAWLGAVTAEDETTEYREPDEIDHDYYLSITVDSISNPIIKLYFGDNISQLEQVVAILDIIIRRNSRKMDDR